MPIRINLLSEALAAEELRRRDPVKRAIYGGTLMVAMSLVWYSSVWLGFYNQKSSLNNVEAEIQRHDKEFAQIQDNKKKISEVQGRLDALDHLNTIRFLQGSMLNGIQQTYVTNVQVSHLHVDQSVVVIPAVTGTNGHPASAVERVVLRLSARDYSTSQGGGGQVKVYKSAILDQLYFKTMLDPDNGVHLASTSPLQTPNEGKPFVDFTIECRFRDRQ